MKKFSFIIITTALLLSFFSCKDDNENEDENQYPAYSQLKVGNYWVYEIYRIDSTGAETLLEIQDSCYVEKDTLINNTKYFKVVKSYPYSKVWESVSYQRDSLHYIVDSNGEILFSSKDFSNVFRKEYILTTEGGDTICEVITKMEDMLFVVRSSTATYYAYGAVEQYKMFPDWEQAGNPRYRYFMYSENIGLVCETQPLFSADPNVYERRLIRYHVAD